MLLRWLLVLFSFSLLVSQTAMDVFAGLVCLVTLYTGYRWREQNSHHTIRNSSGADWLLLAWVGVVFVSYLSTGFAYDNWWLEILNFKWLVVFYLLLAAIRYVQPKVSILPVVATVFGVCCLYAIVVWFLGFDPVRPGEALESLPDGTLRTGGFLSQPIVFAHLYQLPLCLIFASWLMVSRWRDRSQWILSASLVLGLVAILFSFSRGAWISLAAAMLVMTYLRSRRVAFLFVIVSVVLFGAFYKLWPNFHQRIQYAIKGGDAERVWIWKANLQIWQEHPIFGIGYEANKEASKDYLEKLGAPPETIISHAHNQYIHMLAGTGVVGLLIYLAVLGYFLQLSFRVWQSIGSREAPEKGLALGLIGAQVAFIFGGLTEANLEHAKMKYILALIWALVVWMGYEYRILRERV